MQLERQLFENSDGLRYLYLTCSRIKPVISWIDTVEIFLLAINKVVMRHTGGTPSSVEGKVTKSTTHLQENENRLSGSETYRSLSLS